jgi:hypothetical protein
LTLPSSARFWRIVSTPSTGPSIPISRLRPSTPSRQATPPWRSSAIVSSMTWASPAASITTSKPPVSPAGSTSGEMAVET